MGPLRRALRLWRIRQVKVLRRWRDDAQRRLRLSRPPLACRPRGMLTGPNLQGLSHQAREARSWPFEQARLLLDRITRLRLTDAERDLAATLFAEGKFAE